MEAGVKELSAAPESCLVLPSMAGFGAKVLYILSFQNVRKDLTFLECQQDQIH